MAGGRGGGQAEACPSKSRGGFLKGSERPEAGCLGEGTWTLNPKPYIYTYIPIDPLKGTIFGLHGPSGLTHTPVGGRPARCEDRWPCVPDRSGRRHRVWDIVPLK